MLIARCSHNFRTFVQISQRSVHDQESLGLVDILLVAEVGRGVMTHGSQPIESLPPRDFSASQGSRFRHTCRDVHDRRGAGYILLGI